MSEHEAAFLGYWKITKMEVWAQKYVDLVVPGFIEFAVEEDQLTGSFQFGTVVGWVGLPAVHALAHEISEPRNTETRSSL